MIPTKPASSLSHEVTYEIEGLLLEIYDKMQRVRVAVEKGRCGNAAAYADGAREDMAILSDLLHQLKLAVGCDRLAAMSIDQP